MLTETSTFLGFYRRLGVEPSEAEDLVQEVFMKLFRYADSYQPTGRFEAYAFRIARNAWIDRSRRAALRPTRTEDVMRDGELVPAMDTASSEEPPLSKIVQREEATRVESALLHLSDAHRLVFELGVIQELPYGEISTVLEIPEGTVKSRMFHAVRRLRQLLAPPAGAEGVESDNAGSDSQMGAEFHGN